jgi:hypothetical protein
MRLVAELLELPGDEGGCILLPERKFGVGVNVLEDLDQPLLVLLDRLGDLCGKVGLGGFAGGQSGWARYLHAHPGGTAHE